VYNEHSGKPLVSGSVNWAKAGRNFKLEACNLKDSEGDCFLWSEIDKSHW